MKTPSMPAFKREAALKAVDTPAIREATIKFFESDWHTLDTINLLGTFMKVFSVSLKEQMKEEKIFDDANFGQQADEHEQGGF